MGGGVCWLDYNSDGWLDLFVVNSYASATRRVGGARRPAAHRAVRERPRTLRERGRSRARRPAGAGRRLRRRRPERRRRHRSLRHDRRPASSCSGTTATARSRRARAAGVISFGWYTGARSRDVNGDGRPDLFVAGYTDPQRPRARLARRLPDEPRRRARPALPERIGHGALPRGRRAGGARGGEPPTTASARCSSTCNGDGRPDLYVANDEDPNQLYVNVPGRRRQADPAARLPLRERARRGGRRRPVRRHGHRGRLRATAATCSSPTHAEQPYGGVPRARGHDVRQRARRASTPALGDGFAGWGALVRRPRERRAARPRPRDRRDPGDEPREGRRAGAGARARIRPDVRRRRAPRRCGLRLNGRGLAAADYDNDGRDGRSRSTRSAGSSSCSGRAARPDTGSTSTLSRFSPGAVVTATLPDGRRSSRTVQAGSSYLSSEDPRVHFGLGAATTRRSADRPLPVGRREPTDRRRRRPGRDGDRARTSGRTGSPASASYRIAGCTPPLPPGRWRRSGTRRPSTRSVPGTRPSRCRRATSSTCRRRCRTPTPRRVRPSRSATPRTVSSSGARRSTRTSTARSGCSAAQAALAVPVPGRRDTTDATPAAVGNRIGAAAIASGRHDGSHEALHYADPTYVAARTSRSSSACPARRSQDATFWQPLALVADVAARRRGRARLGADLRRRRVGRGAHVRRRAATLHAGPPKLGIPPSGCTTGRARRHPRDRDHAGACARDVTARLESDRGRDRPGDLAHDVRLISRSTPR